MAIYKVEKRVSLASRHELFRVASLRKLTRSRPDSVPSGLYGTSQGNNNRECGYDRASRRCDKQRHFHICLLLRRDGGIRIASVYRYTGEKTADGEFAKPSGLTAAHKTLPCGTRVRVTNKRNGKSVVVRINDRSPFIRGRVIDLTPSGSRALGFSGLAPVTLQSAG